MPKPVHLPSVPTVKEINPHIFINEILPAARPVLIKGFVANWPAVGQANAGTEPIAAYLKALDNGAPTTVLEAPHRVKGRFDYGPDMYDFNFNKKQMSVSAGIDQLLALRDHPAPQSVYIQSTPTPQHLPKFASENPNPILPPQIAPRIWISNMTLAQTHNDNEHNIACVVAGRRRFTLFPPEQLVNLYIGPMERTPSGRAISLADIEEPDFDRFPLLSDALSTAQVAEMEPGDALYVPKYWWHHVRSLTPFNVLINYWWGNSANTADNPLAPFLAALIAMKDLPAPDKSYWKTMLDHYVFQVNGDPVAHIPRQHQGGLGPLTPQTRAEILKALQTLVNGR